MNSIANKIEAKSSNSTEAIQLAEAEKNLVETNQNWEREETTFIFADKSKLVVSGMEYKAYYNHTDKND